MAIALLAAVAALAAPASAHLQPGSLSSPAAGQTYQAGSQVKITWVQAEYHAGKYALSFSRDGGATWEPIAAWTGPGGDGVTVNYAWTVPDAPGAAAKVRVCQIQNCAEADYVLVSGAFTVAPATPVRPSARPLPPSLRFSALEGRLDAAFDLDRAGNVVLEAFDARGILAATLIDGPHAAGHHAYSLSAEGLRSNPAAAFRLRLGSRIVAATASASR